MRGCRHLDSRLIPTSVHLAMPTVLSFSGFEPVTLDEVKQAARVDNDLGTTSSLDGVIATLITTAREQAEQITGRCYRPQTLLVELDEWPSADSVLPVFRPTSCLVRYWSGTWVSMAGSAFAFSAGGPGGMGTVIAPALGSAWPALAPRAAGPRVQIEIGAGPESPAAVAACVKTFITASVAAWLKNPEAMAASAYGPHPLFLSLLRGESTFA